jgi:hypothetical protein
MFFVPRFQGVQGCSVPGQFSVPLFSLICSQVQVQAPAQAPSACKSSGSWSQVGFVSVILMIQDLLPCSLFMF